MGNGIKGHKLHQCGRNNVWLGSDQAIVRLDFLIGGDIGNLSEKIGYNSVEGDRLLSSKKSNHQNQTNRKPLLLSDN